MSTPSQGKENRGSEPRKERHLAICTDPSRFSIEGAGAGFEGVRFVHNALPELAQSELDTSVEFLDRTVRLPFLISCMTGGSEGGFRANQDLARAAEELGIPVGLGSVRVLLENPDLFPQFNVKPLAPSVPVLANIGAVQLRDRDREPLYELLRRLEAQALVVHLNPGQELFQPEGDRDFRGVKVAVARACEESPVPVIVKETGFGIAPSLARELLDAGASYVDLAGAGGTNWITVESYRLQGREKETASVFAEWGIPTAVLLASFGGGQDRLIASGGIRTGVDAAKALALGAELAGFALPVIREVVAGGADAVVSLFRSLERSLRAAMLLTGSRDIAALRRGTTWHEPGFAASVDAFLRAETASRSPGEARRG
ncbi:MAG TPA: type 2 isopentenyl-diphosphate Delta-isomerase [Spirochaetia bacterium]|nr:type 2 isopentenyl-diphosphate Delta-isomerase [Spirochaetia bacterium]